MVYVLSTAGGLIVAVIGYYIFVYKIHQTAKTKKKPLKATERPKMPQRERPKVVLKKDQNSGINKNK